jgi:hypothetical protein
MGCMITDITRKGTATPKAARLLSALCVNNDGIQSSTLPIDYWSLYSDSSLKGIQIDQ